MGNRRLGRRRLQSVASVGEQFASSSAGAGISDSIGSYSAIRDGSMITTDVQIDLANATAPVSAFSASILGQIIGVSSSTASRWPAAGTNPHSAAHLLRVGPEHGVVTTVELICVETPLPSANASFGIVRGSEVSASNELASKGTSLIAYNTAQAIGKDTVDELDANDLNNQYLYLASSGSNAAAATAYTAGKFILRLHGYKQFDDVS